MATPVAALVIIATSVYSGVTGGAAGDRGQGAGAECPPDVFHREIFADLGEKRGKEERENGKEKKEYLKGKRWKIENGRGKSMKMLVTFWNHWNLFGVYQNGQFLPGKGIFHAGRKSRKVTLLPLKNIALTPLTV